MTQNICFLDLEATGFNKQKDSIIEVAFLIRNPEKKITERFESVFKPDKSPLTPFIAQLTGIHQSEIDAEGKNLEDYKTKLKDLIGDSVIVGHNIDFDIEYLIKNGVDISQNKRIDTHELARILLVNEESYALEVLAHKYKFEQTSAHRAMSDVEVNVEIYDWLVDKINALPTDFLETIKPALEQKTDWFAKNLFLNASPLAVTGPDRVVVQAKKSAQEHIQSAATGSETLNLAQHTFVRAGNNLANAAWQKKLAQENAPSVIVTDKLDYFSELQVVPTSKVIFSPARLPVFLANRENLSDQEITFYVQCAWRQHCGHRGQKYFDLFFKQRDLWHEVCLRANNQAEEKIWEEILAERTSDDVLLMSASGYLSIKDHPSIKNRTLVIDEIESFAKTMLLSVTHETNIKPYLDKEPTTVAAQFWVRNVCRDILEVILQKSLPPFPSKVLLPSNATYPDLADAWEEFCEEKDTIVATHLRTPMDGVVRWMNYYPSNGNISIGVWSSQSWKAQRNDLSTKKIIAFTRTPQSDTSIDFVRYFLGLNNPVWLQIDALKTDYALTIPNDLISVKSPDFNLFTAEKIRKHAQEMPENQRLVANFSSQESLQKVYTDLKLGDSLGKSSYSVVGERASGGRGKVAYLAQYHENKVLCTQRAEKVEFSALPYTQFILQRFPFDPPHPLLNRIEDLMKQKGKNFWDIWTMIQVGANLARRAAVFPQVKEIIVLDGRENTRWGKSLLKKAFE